MIKDGFFKDSKMLWLKIPIRFHYKFVETGESTLQTMIFLVHLVPDCNNDLVQCIMQFDCTSKWVPKSFYKLPCMRWILSSELTFQYMPSPCYNTNQIAAEYNPELNLNPIQHYIALSPTAVNKSLLVDEVACITHNSHSKIRKLKKQWLIGLMTNGRIYNDMTSQFWMNINHAKCQFQM